MATETKLTIDTIKKSALVKKIVARCIESKTWRSECDTEVRAEMNTPEGKALVSRYVREQYDAAGAGVSGRWQG